MIFASDKNIKNLDQHISRRTRRNFVSQGLIFIYLIH